MESLTTKEQLALASLIEKNGNNWQSISKMIKAYAEPGRPNDWLNPKQCSQEYEQLSNLVDINERKRNGENITCEHEIIRILTEKRQEELMLFIEEETKKYLKLKQDIYLLENDQLDYNQLENMLQDMELQEKNINMQNKSFQDNPNITLDNPSSNIFENMLRSSLSLDEGANNILATNATSIDGTKQVGLDSVCKDNAGNHLSGEEDDEMEEDDHAMSANILNALNKVEQDVVEMQDRERQEREAKTTPQIPPCTVGSPGKLNQPQIGPTVKILEARVVDENEDIVVTTTPLTLSPSPNHNPEPTSVIAPSPKTSPPPGKRDDVSPVKNLQLTPLPKEEKSASSPVKRGKIASSELLQQQQQQPCVSISEQPLRANEDVVVETPEPITQDSDVAPIVKENVKPKRGRKKKLKTSSAINMLNETKTDTESEITMDSVSDQLPIDSNNLDVDPDENLHLSKGVIEIEQDINLDKSDNIDDTNTTKLANVVNFIKTATRMNYSAPKTDVNPLNKVKQPLVTDSNRFELHSPEHKTWKRSIMLLHSRLCSHNWSDNFFHPITDQIAPCYSAIINYPVDLGTLKKWVESGSVRTTGEYRRWVMLMFQNALMYNSEDHVIYKMTQETYKDALKNIQEYLMASSSGGGGPTLQPSHHHPLKEAVPGTAPKRLDKSPMTGADLQANDGKDQSAQKSPILTRINIRHRISTRQKRNSNLDNRSEDSKSPR